jgi:hypothetical protein
MTGGIHWPSWKVTMSRPTSCRVLDELEDGPYGWYL